MNANISRLGELESRPAASKPGRDGNRKASMSRKRSSEMAVIED
jgi:hypothetical protein